MVVCDHSFKFSRQMTTVVRQTVMKTSQATPFLSSPCFLAFLGCMHFSQLCCLPPPPLFTHTFPNNLRKRKISVLPLPCPHTGGGRRNRGQGAGGRHGMVAAGSWQAGKTCPTMSSLASPLSLLEQKSSEEPSSSILHIRKEEERRRRRGREAASCQWYSPTHTMPCMLWDFSSLSWVAGSG